MLLSILIAILLAKKNDLRISPVFSSCWLLPVAVIELVYIVFQISVFVGYYGFLPYASLLKSLSLYVLILPIIRYKLYKPSIYGSALIIIGTIMNKVVINANHGQMPVYPTISKYTGYFSDSPIGVVDTLHCVGSSDTNLKVLSDYIDLGFSILSPGDLLIHSFTLIIIYYTMKQLHQETSI